MAYIDENDVEAALLAQFAELGYEYVAAADAGPDGKSPERMSYTDVLLMKRLSRAVERLNPQIPEMQRLEAMRQLEVASHLDLVNENKRIHYLIVNGIDVQNTTEDGITRYDKVRLVDLRDPSNNDWVVLNQFPVVDRKHNHRPDIVVFVNGMPLAVIELKNPIKSDATLRRAFHQLETYKSEIEPLFRFNEILVISDGINARTGSLTGKIERFMPWRASSNSSKKNNQTSEIHSLVAGMFEKRNFLSIIQNFIAYTQPNHGNSKIIANYHQFYAVESAYEATVTALAPKGDKKVGVIWHTQGAGKSLSMVFYTGILVRSTKLKNPTIIIVTDRNDLDDQLFSTFSMCQDIIGPPPIQAQSRHDLRKNLKRASGGVIFTTIQKFSATDEEDSHPVLTDRKNVIVIVDEAHRSQYGFKGRIDHSTGNVSYGFARHLRDSLPYASFIGFTGTPLELGHKNTRAVFGDYIHVYNISQSVNDGSTVPIHYESRIVEIELPEDKKLEIDLEIENLTEGEAIGASEGVKKKWAKVEVLIGARKRLRFIARDLTRHLNARMETLAGKAMVVCLSRKICVELYSEIIRIHPDWHSDDDSYGKVKVVMTGSSSDPLTFQPHVCTKNRSRILARRMKDPDDPLQIVIVCDMWLTGFDAPPIHTMYIDKPLGGHNLMQAIARVNRVFRDKPGGLIVDYIGLAKQIQMALGVYSDTDRENTCIEPQKVIDLMLEKYDVVKSMYHGFDYIRSFNCEPKQRLSILAEAVDWILEAQHLAAEGKTNLKEKDKERRRYQDEVLALSKAFALAAASKEARDIRDHVIFFQAVRSVIIKTSYEVEQQQAEQMFAIKQIIDQSIFPTRILNILDVTGTEVEDVSVLSDDFLSKLQNMKMKNLALEILKKILNDKIRSKSRSNVVESKKFSERLEDAIARYHMNAISAVQFLQELISLAQDIKDSYSRGENLNLSDDEIAFYDALAENKSATSIMGDKKLIKIAQELYTGLKDNLPLDWPHRENSRARIRALVRRILRVNKYPPDMQEEAVITVLRQAEVLSEKWTS